MIFGTQRWFDTVDLVAAKKIAKGHAEIGREVYLINLLTGEHISFQEHIHDWAKEGF
jgi:hypothetical protein